MSRVNDIRLVLVSEGIDMVMSEGEIEVRVELLCLCVD